VNEETAGIPVVRTLGEAAGILRVNESWLERQAAARKIPFTMLGGAYHFTDKHLSAIVRLYEHIPSAKADGENTPLENARRKRRAAQETVSGNVAPLRARTARPRYVA
jgi:hypothetical protein